MRCCNLQQVISGPPHLPPQPSLPYIGQTMSKKTRYQISVLEDVGGRKGWHHLLLTEDKEEAEALYESLKQDTGISARYRILPPGVVE